MFELLTTILSGLLGLTTLGPREASTAIAARTTPAAPVIPKSTRQLKSGASRIK